MLKTLNKKILDYTAHKNACSIFFFVSFLSGSFLPLPIDPLFMVLCIENPQRTFSLTLIGALGVTSGGTLMYLLGQGLYQSFGIWIVSMYGWEGQFNFLKEQLSVYGGILIVLKTFTPIPYKLLALVSGIGELRLDVFIGASFLGRFVRLFIVGYLLRFVSAPLKEIIQKHLSVGLGVFFLFLLLLTFLMPFLIKI